jgi:hypothetical protein
MNGKKFDIEQCKADGGKAIYKGEYCRVLEFETDMLGGYPIKWDNVYAIVEKSSLSNIPKKRKLTIYVYKNDDGSVYATSAYPPELNQNWNLIDTVEREYYV